MTTDSPNAPSNDEPSSASADAPSAQQGLGQQELKQLAHALSHDVRAPLRHINGYLSLLNSRYGEHLDSDGREFITIARDGADQAQHLIQALVSYLKIDSRLKAEAAPVTIAQPLNAAIAALQPATSATAAQIDVVVEPTAKAVIDSQHCQQLFHHLLDNAIKFRRDHEPPRITIRSTSVQTDAFNGAQAWQIAVSDDGIGIADGYQQRVFALLQRLHNDDDYPGIGLGLALCKRIVDGCGGQIWIESKPQQGSTVYFTLLAAS